MIKKYEHYKDSYVEWIGDVPEHWEVRKLKYLAKINSAVLPENFDKTKTIYYIDIGNVNFNDGILNIQEMLFKNAPSRARRITKNNDIIVSMVRTYLKAIALINKDGYIVSTGFSVISSGNEINPRFMSFYTKSESFINYISAHSDGVSYPAINQSSFNSSICTIPPELEQQKIASYLDKKSEAIDQFIKNKERLISLLEEEKKAIITKAVTKGLDKNVKLKDSGVEWLGEIPEHWDSSRLATFGKFSKGIGLPKSELVKDGVQAILYGDIYTKYNLKAVNIINHVTEKSSLSSKEIKKGDILFTGSGETKEDIGKCIVYLGYEKAYAGGDIIIFYQKKHDSLFLSYYLNSNLAIDQKIVISKGEIIVHIYASKLKEIYIAIPPLKEQKAIATYLDEQIKKIDDLKAKYRQEIDLIKEYKERLIYDVVTGKINVMQE